MKKTLLFASSFLLTAGTIFGQSAELMSRAGAKKVLLEEFTGMHCTYCPDGHKIAQDYAAQNPGEVFLINIHAGSYATPGAGEPDFRTQWGDAIANASGLQGYPAGQVNRHIFSNIASTKAMDRGSWKSAGNQIKQETSPVNLATSATLDLTTREVKVVYEIYYTDDAVNATNKLNVALLQNNVKGPQTAADQFNPDAIGCDGVYVHQHMLRDLLTGQWGTEISATTSGTYIKDTLTYTLPDDFRGVPVVPVDMEIVAFICEDNDEVLTAASTDFELINLPYQKEAALAPSNCNKPAANVCGDDAYSPAIALVNNGSETLTSAVITYSINGTETRTYNWTGSLAYGESEDVNLSGFQWWHHNAGENEVSIEITEVNGGTDENSTNNVEAVTFNRDVFGNSYTLTFTTDQYASETSWELKDKSGTIQAQGGSYSNNTPVTESFTLTADCFDFIFKDDYGDGVPGANILLVDNNNDTVFYNDGAFGSEASASFAAVESSVPLSIEEETTLSEFNVFPNPFSSTATIQFNINETEEVVLTVTNLLGETVKLDNMGTLGAGAYNTQLSGSELTAGIYFVNLKVGEELKTTKLVLNK